MFFNVDIKGDRLPAGTLCLTYDDGPGQTAEAGPGPRTLELAQYLYDQGILATFFIIGDHAERHPGVLAQLCRWKHTVNRYAGRAGQASAQVSLPAPAESGLSSRNRIAETVKS